MQKTGYIRRIKQLRRKTSRQKCSSFELFEPGESSTSQATKKRCSTYDCSHSTQIQRLLHRFVGALGATGTSSQGSGGS